MAKVEFKKEVVQEIKDNKVKGVIKTLHGDSVRLLDAEAKGELPIIGLIDNGENELVMQWTVNGKRNPERLNTPSIYDLYIEIEDTHE